MSASALTPVEDSSEATTEPDFIPDLEAVFGGRRRWWSALAIGLVIGAVLGATILELLRDSRSDQAVGAPIDQALSTVTVEQRDLSTVTTFAGTLGFERVVTVRSTSGGTVTAVAVSGADLERGDLVYEIDGVPVVLFYGEVPLWRDLDVDVDDGIDVLEVEANLAAMGYTSDGDLVIDGQYDTATAMAVEAWETDLGLVEPDGVFAMASAVMAPGRIRTDDPDAVGRLAQSGGLMFTATVIETITDVVDESGALTGQTRLIADRVLVQIDPSEQDQFAVGQTVDVRLADERMVEGVVIEIGDTARRIGNGPNASLVVDVVIEPATVPGDGLVEGPVTVDVPAETAVDATAVPVRSLVALAEGGYGVEVTTPTGVRLVGVELGLFDDGFVEVVGGVVPGDEVVVPS